jgi:hypothetical protein
MQKQNNVEDWNSVLIAEMERKILFPQAGQRLTRFESMVTTQVSTQGMPTIDELEHYRKYGVFVIETDARLDDDTYIIDRDGTAIRCHPDNETKLRETLLQCQKK